MGVTSSRWASLVLAVVVVAAGLFEVHNLDIGLHARTGQWIVEQGQVPQVNVMSSIHADHPTVDDKWLFQVLTHGLSDGLGPDAVILVRLLLMLALFALLDSTARRLGADPGSRLLMLLLALLAMRTRFMFRPGLISMVMLAAVVRSCLATHPEGRGAARWLLPLQWLWANVHGYFILGPVTVFAVAGGHALRGAGGWPTARRLGWLGLGMAAVCVLNPAGWEGALHPLSILADLRQHYDFYSSNIVEFRGAFADDPRQPFDRLGFYVLGVTALVVLLARVWSERGKPAGDGDGQDGPKGQGPAGSGRWSSLTTRPALVLLAVFAFQTVSLRRNMAPFAVVMAPLAAAALTALFTRRGAWSGEQGRLSVEGAGEAQAPARSGRFPGMILPGVLAAVLVVGEVSDFTSIHDGLDRRWGLGRSSVAYPDVGIDFIEQHLPREGVWTEFGYGSSLTGRRWPEQVASTDGNTHGYPTAWLRSVIEASSGQDPLAFDSLTRRHHLDVALIPMVTPLSLSLLRRDDWVLTCVGREEAVFVRRKAQMLDGPRESGQRVPLVEWLEQHDLVGRLRAGETLIWPSTPRPGRVLGIPRVSLPAAEMDQALMLLALNLPEVALERARAALQLAPGQAQALGLAGLAAARLGREAEARAWLLDSQNKGVRGGIGQLVQQALNRLP